MSIIKDLGDGWTIEADDVGSIDLCDEGESIAWIDEDDGDLMTKATGRLSGLRFPAEYVAALVDVWRERQVAK